MAGDRPSILAGEPPPAVADLVRRFGDHIDAYKSGRYNEAQLRQEFINPLFKGLGWDVDNEQGYAEAYKDVIHEATVQIEGAVKAPDYSFRIGGVRKFFLEAKKPSINIKGDPGPAYQLRRYAWSAKLPLSVLTDFEEFAVYDCRVRPGKTDLPSKARVLYLNYTQYLGRWDEIASVFSRDAILKGSFDKYVESKKRKRGTAEVDAAFLQEIEQWREELARNLALRNKTLTQRELNFAVQVTIDRIIFLRMCEDRGIEDYARLMTLLNGERVYDRLMQRFREADQRYNSGLFHFEREKSRPDPDTLTPDLAIDDKVLKDIIRRLYYPDSPYEFSVLPADILGHVYEQFLGKVIRLTPGHRAKIEEKPEVRKAGGVYYTPTYIVDYIVKHTVGKLLEDRSIKWIGREKKKAVNQPRLDTPLRVLDPACGSGSFLLGAYQYLLDWYLDYYTTHDAESWARKRNPPIYQTTTQRAAAASRTAPSKPQPSSLSYRLTVAERKRILVEHIYGVDIDTQAVEVTKLSLLLKVLEGETTHSLGAHLWYEKERALPDLARNIKCGNSLIGPDFYDASNRQMDMFDEEERYRINVFDWHAEFPDIFHPAPGESPGAQCGFDVVIGNPPYIFTREQLTTTERSYFAAHFAMSWEKRNTFMLFMEAMLRLVNQHGRGAFIVPNSWLTIESGKLLRAALVQRVTLLADLNYPVFERVSMEPCVFAVCGNQREDPVEVLRASSPEEFADPSVHLLDRAKWRTGTGRFVFSGDPERFSVVERILRDATAVGDRFEVRSGLQAYERGKGVPPQTAEDVKNHIFDRNAAEDNNSYRYLQGRDVARHRIVWSGMWMQYGPWLAQPRELRIFTRPRVLLREITGALPFCLHATYTDTPYLNNKSILNVLDKDDDKRLLKLLALVLSSQLISLYYKDRAVKSARRIFPKVVIRNLREFPFPKMIPEDALSRGGTLSDRLLHLHKQRAAAKAPTDKTAIQRQIDATDRQIDQFVYDLYGLTKDEIRIVEEATNA